MKTDLYRVDRVILDHTQQPLSHFHKRDKSNLLGEGFFQVRRTLIINLLTGYLSYNIYSQRGTKNGKQYPRPNRYGISLLA